MAKKSKNKEIGYKTEAEPRIMCGDVPVFCAYDELVPLAGLVPNPRNPNTHPKEQIALLAEIIKAQGWRAPITVSKLSGFIVKGHGRLDAALLIGGQEPKAPVEYQEYATEAEEYADLIVISKPGDVWELGQHRIVCGDSTDPATIDKLMQGEQAQVVNTDPPYGVSYEGTGGNSKKKWDKIENDDLTMDDLMGKLLIPVFKNYMRVTRDDAAFYIWHASSTRRDFADAMTTVGLLEKQYIIWVKNSIVLGRADYQWQHEPAFYCEKAGQSAAWYGDRKQTTTWKVTERNAEGMATVLTGGIVVTDGEGHKIYCTDKPPKGKKTRYVRLSDGRAVTLRAESSLSTVWEVARETDTKHPTQKPVELAIRAIENSSQIGDIVVDFFGGSHSTMIGAELTGRQARICELDPKYVDVGLLRYVQLKGTTGITCERDGKKIDFLDLCEHTATEHGITIEGLIDGTYSTDNEVGEE
ncbi:MAG: site-specific DNA-methyltransferase [Eubacteriaceae bacterium]|nr:site-specific DNA-methyltransferase [Eubacteriaceae bacterium]